MAIVKSTSGVQGCLELAPTGWAPPSLADLPTDWGSGYVAIDTETHDPTLKTLGPAVRRGGYIAGVSLAWEGRDPVYLPIRHPEGNLDTAAVIAYLRDCAARFSGSLVGANMQYDLDYLAHEGIEFPHVHRFRDVQVADPVIYELHGSYSLQAIAERWGMPGKNERALNDALSARGLDKGGIAQLPPGHVGAYAEQDSALCLRLIRAQEDRIERDGISAIYDLECQVLPVLLAMRRRGVAIHMGRLDEIDEWSRTEQVAAVDEANRHIPGVVLSSTDVTKSAALAAAFTAIGVRDIPTTSKGGPSIDAAFIATIDHPAARAIARAKKMQTLRSTFVGGIRKHIVNGRVHGTFNQLRGPRPGTSGEVGAAYGRLSSSNPNMQNQPARDPEIGARWRGIYITDDSATLWASNDMSQQEPRTAIHAAVELGPDKIGGAAYQSAVAAATEFRVRPKTDFHSFMATTIYGSGFNKLQRTSSKSVFLGLSYGMGGAKLCHTLGYATCWRITWAPGKHMDFASREEALARARRGRAAGYSVRVFEAAGPEGSRIIDEFTSAVPFVRETARWYTREASRRGYITTLGGRRCHFPEEPDAGYEWTHKAFNRAIQGGCGDYMKQALVDVHNAGYDVRLQVHDELCCQVADAADARAIADIMERSVPMHLPMTVDVELGRSWGGSMLGEVS